MELNTGLLLTKYEEDLVKSLMFKKHPDSGQPIVLKSDRVLSLPYHILQYRHPPFFRSSPLADRRIKRLPPGMTILNHEYVAREPKHVCYHLRKGLVIM